MPCRSRRRRHEGRTAGCPARRSARRRLLREPALPGRLLESARMALRTADVAIGPAEDGGFYLLALRRCPEGLLRDLPWSSVDTLHATLKRLRVLGLRTTLLDPWFDVDRVEDL